MTEKKIEIKRYRPLWGVLDPTWDDNWDGFRKIASKLTGGDNANHIRYCVKHEFLNVELVLDRIKEFTDKKDPFPYQIKDSDAVYDDLNRTMLFCKEGLNKVPDRSKSMEELLLLMFELGTQVGALNNQDLIQTGRTSIIDKHRAGAKGAEQRERQGKARQAAYLALMHTVKESGNKPTTKHLKAYLKSNTGCRFQTGIEECPEIWIENNGFVDSIGNYSDSAVSKLKFSE